MGISLQQDGRRGLLPEGGPADDELAAPAGAGAVGRSIARELIGKKHQVLLIDKDPAKVQPGRVKGAEWLLGDACEVANLEEAALEECDVVVGATGDDKVNLVLSIFAIVPSSFMPVGSPVADSATSPR